MLLNKEKPRGMPIQRWMSAVLDDLRAIDERIRIEDSEYRDLCRGMWQTAFALDEPCTGHELEEEVGVYN